MNLRKKLNYFLNFFRKEFLLFFNGAKTKKMFLVLALNKDGNCVSVVKDVRYIKKAVLILKVNRDEGLSENLDDNFLFIEISKTVLEQMQVICRVRSFS